MQQIMAMVILRGIKNVTGVGCHLSCALLILCYSLTHLRDTLLLLLLGGEKGGEKEEEEVKKAEKVIVFQLVRLLKEMTTSDITGSGSNAAVDPSNFFQVIQKDCNAYDLGDATKAITVLLQCIKKGLFKQQQQKEEQEEEESGSRLVEEIRHEFQSLYQFLLCGTKEQIICGRKRNIVRTKRKTSPLMNPFPLKISSCSSIQEAIQVATTQPIPIKGSYNWDDIPSETYKEEILGKEEEEQENEGEEEEECQEWVTTRQQRFVSLPVFFMLHLQRFQYNNKKVPEASQQIIDIPLLLNHLDYTYQLVGGILHSDYEDDDDIEEEDEDYEGGHYTALLRSPQPSSPQQPSSSDGNEEDVNKDQKKWNLVDGTKVTEISQQDAMDLLSGKPTTTTAKGTSSSTTRGTLLVYSRQYATTDDGEQQAQPDETINQMLDRIRTLVSKAKSEGCFSLFSTTQPPTNAIASLPPPPSPLSKLLPAAAETKTAAAKDAFCNNNDPMQLIGKRLRIRWSGGTFYSGVIVEYNPSTKKHTVRYDDGDIKQYKLHKKVIEWE